MYNPYNGKALLGSTKKYKITNFQILGILYQASGKHKDWRQVIVPQQFISYNSKRLCLRDFHTGSIICFYKMQTTLNMSKHPSPLLLTI